MKRWALVILAALGTVGFLALGVWQIERREWKLALISRVEQRVHAAPVAAPGPSSWPAITRENSEYLRVTATGHFIEGRETRVRALTELGSGYWVMAPFQTDNGFTVLVNRGFVAMDQGPERHATPTRADSAVDSDGVLPTGHTTVTGLLRVTEPNGGFLRANVPGQEQWYSRDVQAIAQARKLSAVAPYFIDAERDAGPAATPARSVGTAGSTGPTGTADATGTAGPTEPIAGLTVVTFRNSHLSYAITWFALALMTALFGLRLAGARPFNAGTTRASP